MPGTAEINNNYGIIILAAGASMWLGRPKQLLVYKSKPLLRHIADIVTAVNTHPIIVVPVANNNLTAKKKLPAVKIFMQ